MKERWERRERKLHRRRYGMMMSGKGFRDRMNELARKRAELAHPAPAPDEKATSSPQKEDDDKGAKEGVAGTSPPGREEPSSQRLAGEP